MAVVPVPYTWVAGAANRPTATELNGNDGPKGVGDFLLSPPRASAYQTTGTSTSSSTSTENMMSFDTTRWDEDTADMHDPVTLNSRIYIRTPGLYSVSYQVGFPANGTGVRYAILRKNAGSTSGGGTAIHFARQQAASGTGASYVGATLDVPLVEDDYLEVFAIQNSGSSLTTVTGVTGTYIQVRWVASS